MILTEMAFKFIPISDEFGYDGKMYIKTNFQRGYFWKEGRKVFRHFKKRTLVNTISDYFALFA